MNFLHKPFYPLLLITFLALASFQVRGGARVFSLADSHSSAERVAEVKSEEMQIIGPIFLDPIIDYLDKRDPLSAQRFIDLFGKDVFQDSRIDEMIAVMAQRGQTEEGEEWVDVLSIFGRGDPRVESFVYAVETKNPRLFPLLRLLSGGERPLHIQELMELLGSQDPREAQLLSLIQGGKALNVQGVLRLFGHQNPSLLALVDLMDQNLPLNIAKVIELLQLRDPQLATIAQVLSGGGKLNARQVMALMGGNSVHPKIAALISWLGPRQGTISLFDLVEDEGVLSHLLREQSRQDILAVVESSSNLERVFRKYSQVPVATLLYDNHFFYLTSMLNEVGVGKLQNLLRGSRSLRELLAQKGKFPLESILSDNVIQLAGDGSLPVSIRSYSKHAEGAILALTGSFRGSFGQIRGSALEVVRIANIGESPAHSISLGSLRPVFQVENSGCGETLPPGGLCEILLRASGTNGRERVLDQFVISFSDGDSSGNQLRVPLDVLISNEMDSSPILNQ